MADNILDLLDQGAGVLDFGLHAKFDLDPTSKDFEVQFDNARFGDDGFFSLLETATLRDQHEVDQKLCPLKDPPAAPRDQSRRQPALPSVSSSRGGRREPPREVQNQLEQHARSKVKFSHVVSVTACIQDAFHEVVHTHAHTLAQLHT